MRTKTKWVISDLLLYKTLWSRWEVFHQLLLPFVDVEFFLTNNKDLGETTIGKN